MTTDAHEEKLKTGAAPDLLYSRERELDIDEVDMFLTLCHCNIFVSYYYHCLKCQKPVQVVHVMTFL